jgi:hypothetical protein
MHGFAVLQLKRIDEIRYRQFIVLKILVPWLDDRDQQQNQALLIQTQFVAGLD